MAAISPSQSPTKAIEFSTRLRAIMDAQGLTGAEVARRMSEHLPDGKKISPATISHYRTGHSIPRGQNLDALVSALRIERSELADLLDVPPRPERSAGAKRTHASNEVGHISVDDLGDEVHLKIDLRAPWKVALVILEAIGRSKAE